MLKTKSEHGATCSLKRREGQMTRRKAMALPLGVALVLGTGGLIGCTGDKKGKSFSVLGGETRPVLNPRQFSSPVVREAYAMADRNKAVLDKLFCYCQCYRPPFHHKSLLSCFAETHGAG